MAKEYPWEVPSFFKVMIGDDFGTTVRIPPKFNKHLRDNVMVEKAMLRMPGRNGQWAVDIGNVDGDFYFQRGWEGFAADNSISNGDFLTFFYLSNLVFDVVIYGTTGCKKKEEIHRREVNVETEMPIEVDISEQEKTSSETLLETDTNGHERVSSEKPAQMNIKEKVTEENAAKSVSSRKWKKPEWKKSKLCYKVMRAKGAKDGEDVKVIEAACAFRTTHPHFIVTCRATRSKFMPIPTGLDRLYNLGEKCEITLRNVHGKTWSMKISSWRDGRRCLSSPWPQVYKDSRLKEGDACLLEFVGNETNVEINLHIFRGTENKEKSHSGKAKKKERRKKKLKGNKDAGKGTSGKERREVS